MAFFSLGLIIGLFICGIVSVLAGFLGLLYPILSVLLFLPFIFFLFLLIKTVRSLRLWSKLEKFLFLLLAGIWLLHLAGVWVPETGFDAVWYHLPIAQQFVEHHRIFYIPNLYQSLNPQFSDMIFLLGFQVAGTLGAKFVAYFFGLSLILFSYLLSRTVLDRFWSLLTVVIISTFQVVAWQSSSFYVDVAKAVWEVASLWVLFQFAKKRWSLFAASLLLGASFASKLFSIFLLPVFLTIKHFWKYALVSLAVGIPFYFFAYHIVGNPFYSFQIHTNKLSEIGGQSSLFWYVVQRTLTLPSSLTQLTLFSRDYTTLIFLVFLPVFLLSLRKIWKAPKLRTLLFFSAAQYFMWWYIPPFSTRYALSGFVTMTLLFIWSVQERLKEKPEYKTSFLMAIGISLIINILPRAVPLRRTIIYFEKHQSTSEYVRQFYDGNIDEPLRKWYGLSQ